MKLNNMKIRVETDEQNQYVLQQHIKINEECAWYVYLGYGDASWFSQGYGSSRAVCSVWKGFRHLVIDKDGDLILCIVETYYNNRKENESTFAEFQEMCEPKKTLWDKRLCIMHSGDYTQKDVKEALKEFMLCVDTLTNDTLATKSDRHKKAKEIFGDELL